jgi:signal transduction histidine kinase
MLAERLLQVTGVALWLAVGVPALGRPLSVPWLAGWLGWLAAFLAFTEGSPTRPRPVACLWLAVQVAAVLLMAASAPVGFAIPLLVAVAGQLPFALPMAAGVAWIAAQTALLAATIGLPWRQVGDLFPFATFQLFALAAAFVAVREGQARQELARVNAELLATRELLAETSRNAERLRIARDLHDTIGHHLTALNLNLEVAAHAQGAAVAEHVQRAQALGKLLMTEVREVVSDVREERPLDLGPALRTLVAATAPLRTHLTLPPDLAVRDAAQAEVLFRCVQEIVTNAVRHAGARNLWIEIATGAGGIELTARDDGRGGALKPGHGLTGMRERVEQAGGRLEIDTAPGRGFALKAVL